MHTKVPQQYSREGIRVVGLRFAGYRNRSSSNTALLRNQTLRSARKTRRFLWTRKRGRQNAQVTSTDCGIRMSSAPGRRREVQQRPGNSEATFFLQGSVVMSTGSLAGRPLDGSENVLFPLAEHSGLSLKKKRLIVNADDLGLSRGITDGILFSHQQGIVTSASYMVNQPASEYAAERLREFPTLDVGIHLNLCQGKPVLPPSAVPTLVDSDGCFLPPPRMARRLTLWRASPKEIHIEFCADRK